MPARASRRPVGAGGAGTPAERVTGHSLHDAIDDAIEHVVENDRKHPPHDEVPTASRDEQLSGTPAARTRVAARSRGPRASWC